MFKHAVETFEHGLEHYAEQSEQGRKFALLHIDQAIELLLKEKIVQLGKSIYKTDGTTLTFHEAFRSLKDLSIPERPRLEELHDLRNTIQHKGLIPDSGSTQFYVDIASDFFRRFLNDELSTPSDKILSKKYRTPEVLVQTEPPRQQQFDASRKSKRAEPSDGVQNAVPSNTPTEASEVVSLFQNALAGRNPTQKIMTGYTALSLALTILGGNPNLGGDPVDKRSFRRAKLSFRRVFRNAAKRRGFSSNKSRPHLMTVLGLRNRVVHSNYEPRENDAETYLTAVGTILHMVGFL